MKYIKYILITLVCFLLFSYVGNKILLKGIERFYGLDQQSDVLMIGHSHLMLAVDKNKVEAETGMKISKYTREGVNVYDRYFMLKQYLDSPYSDSLKVVLYGVDMYSFVASGLSENSYTLFYPFMDEPIMNNYIRENASAKNYWLHKLLPLKRYSDALINAAVRGWRNDFSNYKSGIMDVESYKKGLDQDKQYNRSIEIDPKLLALFEESINMATQRGIRFIMVNTPLVDVLNEVNADNMEETNALFQHWADSNKLVEYWDFNPNYSSDHSLFYDPIHLNPQGQAVITKEIIKKMACF